MPRYPLCAAAMARPTPVLPDVGSTIVPPGFSLPSRSAFSIIARPIRSLTEPPGLTYSNLARSLGSTSAPIESSRTIGVLPTSSRTEGYSRAIVEEPTLQTVGKTWGAGLVAEVAASGEHHRGAGRSDGLGDLVVAFRAARLDDPRHAG